MSLLSKLALAALLSGAAPAALAREDAGANAPGLVDRMSLQVARDHQRHGRLDEAEAQLAPQLKRSALGAEGRQLLGEIAAERGEWKRAEAHYRAALAQTPNAAGLHLRLGQALERQGRQPEAERAYDRYHALRTGGQP